MERRTFGTTGLTVSVLGLGAGQVGADDVSDADAERLLHRALDLGVTLIDTARGYGRSEERIGRFLSGRRDEFVLSTKGGYGVDGVPDWTPECLRLGIERALRTLRTDVIDVFHLHSCPLDTLQRDDLLGALDAARDAGQVRVVAYSGENDALAWAVQSGRFGSVETSVNFADQWSARHVLPDAAARGLGVIAKRPLANAPWRHAERPVGQYVETYWVRAQALGLDPRALPWDEFALRFSAFQPGVSSVIAGTARVENLERNARALAAGPLPADLLAEVDAAWAREGQGWGGEV
ncbi:aldo/keto reductase [Deinococcus maricopensis]|uniref:NADP-dependent oxidoreductase domain protein n=1 Tax=Deinococcus maricopensis (strain DSM 21211 / LMG 22137 / NRRL B-23946 / LB-34) TaxID=709986 RepID=E8U741_DEIML|nr:aldo/keto reductase [Deinococcus maricopensis]ADV66880.1 NADP-dependent oxidoreductase domain protein [Deinococcus maricopensis DSM 21211]